MKFKCFLSSVLIIAFLSGCNNSSKVVDKDVNSITTTEQSTEVTTEASTEAAVESDTPEAVSSEFLVNWELVSASTVKSSVHYAGFLNESLGITAGYSGAISYSSNGGENWSKSGNVSYCRYGMDMLDDAFIMTSGNGGLNLVTNDQGKTWKAVADFPLKSSAFYNKFLSIYDAENIWIGSAISFGVSHDRGKTWEELAIPEGCKSIASMFLLSPEIGYMLGADGTLYKTTDSAATWTSTDITAIDQIMILNMPGAALNFQDENNGMIVYADKNSYAVSCLTTTDSGTTWVEEIGVPKSDTLVPYISRDGKLLTLSSKATGNVNLYKLNK